MSLILSGTDGLSDVDGSAATPAIRGTDSNTGIFFPAADTIAFAEGGAEVARFDSSGNLGIGTASPTVRLHVSGSSNFTAGIESSNTFAILGFKASGSTGTMADPTVGIGGTGDALYMRAGGSERCRIDSSGNLLVGTTTSSSKLTLDGTQTYRDGADSRVGTIRFASGCLQIATNAAHEILFLTNATERARIDGSGNLLVGCTSTPSASVVGWRATKAGDQGYMSSSAGSSGAREHWYLYNTNGLVGTVSTSGTSTTYATSSDYRLKEDIQPMTGALSKVAALKPVTYKWKIDGSDSEGFIAHELADVCPQAVTGEKDAIDAEGNPKYQGIDTSFLVATLTAAIQELKAEFDAYKASHP
jgi:hypothetical protein